VCGTAHSVIWKRCLLCLLCRYPQGLASVSQGKLRNEKMVLTEEELRAIHALALEKGIECRLVQQLGFRSVRPPRSRHHHVAFTTT
jgi:hypothetical protein